ncbi:uncharacterized protein BX663DRAFT_235298 [Cokeromyces recurvatus]|uniref:uncharacterized protein n=1 Tax=Cokeromyces recurvatus TaxID=90255 RepID=UPI002220BE94|nr:uncharacterized protein BX663DRAFT_235298 [Cokeromyces recurvatus]KAI7898741.1 hypothetical protein BX663DRAFT_235298 [Cokeromyces recurvatus]
MFKSQFFLLFIVIVICLISTIETAKTSIKKKTTKRKVANRKSKIWKFYNWNKYGKATVGRDTVWDKTWGIPEHGGWLWYWKDADKLKNVLVKAPSGKKKDLVLRVTYPKNSRNPEENPVGGLGFKAEPLTIDNKVRTVEFQYSVFFPKGFDFNRGKLPGLYGGHGDCTGGDGSKSCFTTRFMWRDGGEGEIYAYLPESAQRSDLCDNKINICNPDYGFSLGRGTFKFTRGKWLSIRQTVVMNTPGKMNGQIIIHVNGKRVFTEKKLVIRTNSSSRVAGIMFHTFFGGSDNTWETPKTQYSYFKNFSLKAIY